MKFIRQHLVFWQIILQTFGLICDIVQAKQASGLFLIQIEI